MNVPHWTSQAAVVVVPARRDDIVVEKLDGEATLADPQDGSTYLLNQTAFCVWQRCNGSATTMQIARELTDIYDVGLEMAHDHVLQLSVLFAKSKLIRSRQT